METFKTTRPAAPTVLHDFCQTAAPVLKNAASLLAGPKGRRLVDDIVEALARSRVPDRRTLRNLVQLHRILSLSAVDDTDSDSEAFFMSIDPTDPVVEEICLLSDSLLHALRDYASAHSMHDLTIAA